MIQNKNRDIGIDLVKFIAIFGVLIIHTCSYSGSLGSFEWTSSLFWGSISRGSVPLFLMASGALMLHPEKEISIRKLYFKNILRLLIAMFVWAMLYKVFHLLGSDMLTAKNLISSAKEVLLFNQEFHLYYIHLMIIVYVFMPIVRTFVCNSNKQQLQYALAVWLMLGVVYPDVDGFWPFNLLGWVIPMWKLNMVYAAIGYGILGYYLKKHPVSSWFSFIMIVAGFAVTYLGTYYSSLRDGFLQEDPFYSGMGIGATMLAIGFFSLANTVRIKNEKTRKIITWFSLSSFCIYLCHMIVMYVMNRYGINDGMFHPLASIPCVVIINALLSSAVYFVISKMPLLKKWIV